MRKTPLQELYELRHATLQLREPRQDLLAMIDRQIAVVRAAELAANDDQGDDQDPLRNC